MDASTVRSWLVSTADADADVRRRAELELKKVSGGLIVIVVVVPSPSLIVAFLRHGSAVGPWVDKTMSSPEMLTIPLRVQGEQHPGFTDVLLDIIQAEQNASIQLQGTPTPNDLRSDGCVSVVPL